MIEQTDLISSLPKVQSKLSQIWVICIFLFVPSLALANAGAPMLAVNGAVLTAFLLLIILIESFFLASLLKRPFSRILQVVSFSNLCSTFVGIPLVWLALLALQLCFGSEFYYFGYRTFWQQTLTTLASFPALTPYQGFGEYHLSLAASVLHIIFFFISFRLERAISWKLMPELSKRDISKAVLWGNITTYAIMIPATIAWIYSPLQGWFNWWSNGSLRFYIFPLWVIAFIVLFGKCRSLLFPKEKIYGEERGSFETR